MDDDYKKPQLPVGMGERDPKLSVWDNIAKHFKSREPNKPQAKVESDTKALAEVSKSFKSAF